MASTTSTSLTPTFTGTSKYASDLQQVLTRAIAIASLPLNTTQTDISNLQNQSDALNQVDTQFTALQTAISNLSNAVGTGALTPTVSNNSVLSAQASAGALAGTYQVNVISTGSATDLLSNDGLPTVTDPSSQSISSSSSFTLTVNGSTYTVNPASNSLSALAQAINSSGAAVNATVVNIGSSSSPDYRLAIQSTDLGNVAVQLNDGTSDLLNTVSTGSEAQYQVNGQPSTPISSTSDNVTIAPGLTVNLLAAGNATITVGQSTSAAASAISSFVTAYNAALDSLTQHHGQNGGALTGESIVTTLGDELHQLDGYTNSSGTVQSLADLGITVDDQGHLQFNQSQFESLANTNPNAVATFFGSATGSGFLQNATNILTGIEDPTTGILKQEENSVQSSLTTENNLATTQQAAIDTLQANLTTQISDADAAIASLESQLTLYTGLFSSFTNANGTSNS